jgi:hypothetical protein
LLVPVRVSDLTKQDERSLGDQRDKIERWTKEPVDHPFEVTVLGRCLAIPWRTASDAPGSAIVATSGKRAIVSVALIRILVSDAFSRPGESLRADADLRVGWAEFGIFQGLKLMA